MIRCLKSLGIILSGLVGWIFWCIIITSFGIDFAVIITSFGIGFAAAMYIVYIFHEIELYKEAHKK
jgi:high-affinity Fe2+/Pb2+ permease